MNILCIRGVEGACFELLIAKPLNFLKQNREVYFKNKVASEVTSTDLLESDVVFFIRNCEYPDTALFQKCKQLGKPVIYFIDDYLLNIPQHFGETAVFHNAPHRMRNRLRMLKNADLIIAGTKPLAIALSKHSDARIKVFPLPNPEEYYAPVKHSTDGVCRFVLVLTTAHSSSYAKVVAPAIDEIIKTHGERVEFLVFGTALPGITGRFANVRHIESMPMDAFAHAFCQTSADAALAFLENCPFNRCKTNNKFREFAARGLAGLYSHMPVYADCVANEKTGILVGDSSEDWFNGMDALVKYPEKTKRIGLTAREYAEAHYRVEFYANALWESLTQLVTERRPLSSQKQKTMS